MDKKYVVVYMVDGTHYRYRTYTKNKRNAKEKCMNAMCVSENNIVEVYEEE